MNFSDLKSVWFLGSNKALGAMPEHNFVPQKELTVHRFARFFKLLLSAIGVPGSSKSRE